MIVELGGMIENKNCQQMVTFLGDVPVFKDFDLISKEDYHLGWLVYAKGLCSLKKFPGSSFFAPSKDPAREQILKLDL